MYICSYLGRRIVNPDLELEDTDTLVYPGYSYWALSYILSLEGAKKLINQQPLSRMIPVDEYLPVMYNEHPK